MIKTPSLESGELSKNSYSNKLDFELSMKTNAWTIIKEVWRNIWDKNGSSRVANSRESSFYFTGMPLSNFLKFSSNNPSNFPHPNFYMF